jgi:hypothetical protein
MRRVRCVMDREDFLLGLEDFLKLECFLEAEESLIGFNVLQPNEMRIEVFAEVVLPHEVMEDDNA